jgi:outer membrane biosynthesis protein TonB
MIRIDEMNQDNVSLKIRVLKDGQQVAEKIFESFPVIFGRSEDCHLCLKGFKYVSRSHGSISINKDQIFVTDLNSSNGIVFENKKSLRFTLKHHGGFEVQDLRFDLELVSRIEETLIARDEKTEVSFKPELPLSPEGKVISSSISSNWKMGDFEWKKLEFSLQPDPEIRKLQMQELALQGSLMWEDEIYDVRNFGVNERIKLGPDSTEPVDVPVFQKEIDFGEFTKNGASILIPKRFSWKLYRDSVEVSLSNLIQTRRLGEKANCLSIFIALNEVVVIELGGRMQFRLRYVPIPRPLIRKTWIENRDEFKRAITISILIHAFLSVVAIALAPAAKGPKVKDVPPRFAKLLVEPPKQTFAFEPPPPPPPPKEPEPVPEIIEPPTLREAPKPIVESKAEAKKPVEKKVARAKPTVKADTIVEKPIKNESPKPSAEQEMANLFNSLSAPSDKKGTGLNVDELKIKKSGTGSSKSATKVSGLVTSTSSTSTSNSELGLGLGSQAGKTSYAQTKNSKAGQHGVVGAVIGTPSFKWIERNQGISNDEVMSVVNKHLPEVYRCYERALFNDSNIIGRVEYEWEINASGVVEAVFVKRSEVSNGDFLNTCVTGVFKKMRFPSAKNGQSTTANIGFPFGKN